MDWLLLAESPAPEFDAVYWLAITSRMLHTLSAAVLVGGLVFLKQVVAPVAVGAEDKSEALYRGQRAAWSRLVMITSFFLLASGFYNYVMIIQANEKLPGLYHMLFGIKFLLALVVMFIAAATAGRAPMAENMRAKLNTWLNLCLLIVLAIFIIGAMLRSFDKVPREEADREQLAVASDADHLNPTRRLHG